uniref:glutamine-hydrolyzing GMP synthase n=1 Tax=Pseudomonas viridiflava TaxID=33069 RepID=UPI000F02F971
MALDIHAHRILILDFGSQYTQLIARRVREIGVYCELHPFDMDDEAIREFAPRGIILAGGPESVHEANSPRAPQAVFDLNVPIFGICYGMQTMAEQLGGRVAGSDLREFGYARVDVVGKSRILDGIEDHIDADGVFGLDVWMSHGDKVTEIPDGFHVLASTPSCPIAGMADDTRGYSGVQFDPEVTATIQRGRI